LAFRIFAKISSGFFARLKLRPDAFYVLIYSLIAFTSCVTDSPDFKSALSRRIRLLVIAETSFPAQTASPLH
jgi:hypothetical protein